MSWPPRFGDREEEQRAERIDGRRHSTQLDRAEDVGHGGLGSSPRLYGFAAARVEAPALAITTSPIAIQSRSGEVLAEHDEAGQRGDRRLERHQHAEHALRQRAQRLDLERVGQHGRGDRDREQGAEQLGLEELGAGVGDPERRDEHRARHHRDREPAAAGEERAGALGEHDVGRPQRAGGERERDADAGRATRPSSRRGRGCRPRRAPPTAGRAAAARATTARPSGPMNSNVTATPSGIRSIAS